MLLKFDSIKARHCNGHKSKWDSIIQGEFGQKSIEPKAMNIGWGIVPQQRIFLVTNGASTTPKAQPKLLHRRSTRAKPRSSS